MPRFHRENVSENNFENMEFLLFSYGLWRLLAVVTTSSLMMKKRAMIRSTAIKDRRNEDPATGSNTIVTMATNTDFRMQPTTSRTTTVTKPRLVKPNRSCKEITCTMISSASTTEAKPKIMKIV